MSDSVDFIMKFESGQVAPEGFDHRAHVHLAWCYLQQYSLLESVARFTAALQAFTRRVGAEDKYHETITIAFLLLIADRMERGQSWTEFAQTNGDWIDRGMRVMHRHYSEAALANEGARLHFAMPDRVESVANQARLR